MTDLEDLADRVLRHACPDPLCKHDSCKTFREAADVDKHEELRKDKIRRRDERSKWRR